LAVRCICAAQISDGEPGPGPVHVAYASPWIDIETDGLEPATASNAGGDHVVAPDARTVANTAPPSTNSAAARPALPAATTAWVAVAASPASICSGGCHSPPDRREAKTCETPATSLR
jgi:hypothetical protein